MSTSPLAQERIAFEAAFVECGFHIPADASRQALRATVAQQYMPTESYPVHVDDYGYMTERTKMYLRLDVSETVRRGIDEGDAAMLKLGHAAGRYVAATFAAGKANSNLTLHLGNEKVEVGDHTLPITFDKGRVVEYGMGLGGLVAHLPNLLHEQRPYKVAGLTNFIGEVALLDGFADYFGVGDAVINDARGISHSLEDMLAPDSEYKEGVDLLVISSVNSRDSSFIEGIEKASKLLRSGGLLIATGLPRDNQYGIGYRRIGGMISRDRRLDIKVFEEYEHRLPKEESVLRMLTVAQKRG